MVKKIRTDEKVTWCPGCLNNGVLAAFEAAVSNLLEKEEIDLKKTTIVADIGCGAKIYDYLKVNAFYGLHGRVLPTAFGIKTANPELTVIGFGGDGGTYGEGLSHFIHNCRYNLDMTMIVLNNRVYALTKGQLTPTAIVPDQPKIPVNPLALAITAGASFVARGTPLNLGQLTKLIEDGIKHKGFSIIDIVEPCLIFNNDLADLRNKFYELEALKDYNYRDKEGALKKAEEWDQGIPLGVLFKNQK